MMMPEDLEEEEGSPQSRLFVILAVALIGLLVLGLLGIGGVFVIRQNMREQASAIQPTPTLMIRLPNPTATFTPVSSVPTNTPAPTPTNTPVVVPGGTGQEAAIREESGNGQAAQTTATPNPTPTRTPVSGAAPAGNVVVPETGVGGVGAALIAAGLAGVFFVARRLRTVL